MTLSSVDRPRDWLGKEATKRIKITSDLFDAFVPLSGDASPIHMSDAAAQKYGFPRRVVHGMLLCSLVSGVLGMDLPGERGVLQDVQISFRKPCHLDDEILIRVCVVEFFESVQTLILKVSITRQDGVILASGRIQCGLR